MQNLVASLAQQFGLRPEQVQAGVGAVLQLLQEKAGGPEFQQLLGKLPGAQGWIEQARALVQGGGAGGGGGGLLGQAGSLLGAIAGGGQGGGGLASLLGTLGQAGFKPETATQFVPALLEQLKGAAGPDTLNRVLDQVPALKQAGGGLLGNFLK